MLGCKFPKIFQVENIFRTPTAEEEPADSVWPLFMQAVDNRLHGGHAHTPADTDQFRLRVFRQTPFTERPGESADLFRA